MSLEGQVFLISLTEVQLDHVQVDECDRITWSTAPDNPAKQHLVDGVVAIYDVTRQGSISRIPSLLSRFSPYLGRFVATYCTGGIILESGRFQIL